MSDHPSTAADKSKKKKKPDVEKDEASALTDAPENQKDIPEAEEVEAEEITVSKDDWEEKDKQIANLKEQMLRLRAETDNFRKRLSKNKEDSINYANEKIIKEIISIFDNLERALSASNVTLESLREGVHMISKQFNSLFEKHKVEAISSVGQPFDPAIHEALCQQVSDDHEDNTVIEEYSKGYRYKGRVLIPARVVTSKKSENTGTDESEGESTAPDEATNAGDSPDAEA